MLARFKFHPFVEKPWKTSAAEWTDSQTFTHFFSCSVEKKSHVNLFLRLHRKTQVSEAHLSVEFDVSATKKQKLDYPVSAKA